MFTHYNRPLAFMLAPDGTEGEGATTTPPPPATTTTPPAPTTISQEQANALGAREKAEGRASAERAAAEALGMTVEEAAAVIARAKEAERATMSEADKAKADAQLARDEANRIRAEAQLTLRGVHVRGALVGAGVADPKVQTDLAKLVTIPEGTAEADLETVAAAQVADLKQRYPAMFGGAAGGPAPSHQPGTRPVPPPGGQQGMTAFERGAAAAAAQFPNRDRSASTNPFD